MNTPPLDNLTRTQHLVSPNDETRWRDGVLENMGALNVRDWKSLAENRSSWKSLLQEFKNAQRVGSARKSKESLNDETKKLSIIRLSNYLENFKPITRHIILGDMYVEFRQNGWRIVSRIWRSFTFHNMSTNNLHRFFSSSRFHLIAADCK